MLVNPLFPTKYTLELQWFYDFSENLWKQIENHGPKCIQQRTQVQKLHCLPVLTSCAVVERAKFLSIKNNHGGHVAL